MSVDAVIDLTIISEYIAKISGSPQIASNYSKMILEKIDSLSYFPERFPIKDERLKLRVASVKKYNLYYRVDKNNLRVSVERILYSGVDMSKITIG